MVARGGRQYRDPIKARLTVVEQLKPHQWAGLATVVARNAERGAWSPEEATQVLDMLGLDKAAAREAKQALKRARRLKLIYASAPTPKSLPEPRVRHSEPVAVVSDAPAMTQVRDKAGKFASGELCNRGLHALEGRNRMTRPDRPTIQCRECTKIRKRAEYRAKGEAA